MNLKKSFLLLCVSLVLGGGVFFANWSSPEESVQAAGSVTAPTFNKQSGCYDEGFSLSLQAGTGCKIYYTTDGTVPYVPNGSGTTQNQSEYVIPATAENVHTAFSDQTTAQNTEDGVKLEFAYQYKSLSFVVPEGMQDWSDGSKLLIEYTVNNYRNGSNFNLQVCPIIAGAKSSYQDNGVSTRVFDYTQTPVSGTGKKVCEIDLGNYPNLSSIGYLMLGNATGNINDGVNANKDAITIHSIKVLTNKIPKKETPKEYTGEILVKNRQGESNVLSANENITLMYNGVDRQPYYPSKADVAKATVIRAIAVNEAGEASNVVTRTYFIGNDIYNKYKNASVISIVTDPDNLLSKKTGIYRVGNYQNSGAEWERDAFVEYFEGDGTIPFATTMGIRIHGGYSRHWGQKSFNLYFREELGGLKNLKNYELIPGATNFDKTKPSTKFKNFMLRNGGNDTELTKLQDVFIQSLVEDRAYTTQGSKICVLFLNGEYWGPYNLTEKYSDNYLEEEFGINKDNAVAVKSGELDEGVDSDMDFYYDFMDMSKLDMTQPENYAAFCELVDIQSFADYFATEAYIGNKDWPNNNEQLWRTREKEDGNKYADTKWRYMLFDTEFSMNLYEATGNNFDGIAQAKQNKLFNAVIKNTDFQELFVTTMMDLYNVNFEFDSSVEKLHYYQELYRPFIVDYVKRFGSIGGFDSNVGRMERFMEARRVNLFNYLQNHLGVNNQAKLTIESNAKQKDLITVNTTTPDIESGSWSGIYFQEYPIVVKAKEKAGYHFNGWEVTGGTADDTTAVEMKVTLTSQTAKITAKYTVDVVTPAPSDTPGPTITPGPTNTLSPTSTPKASPKPTSTPVVKVGKATVSKLTTKKKSLTIKLKKVSGAKGYQIVYATDKKFKKGKRTMTSKSSTITIKKLKSKKTYYVKARAYKMDNKGKKVYGNYSTVKYKKVK